MTIVLILFAAALFVASCAVSPKVDTSSIHLSGTNDITKHELSAEDETIFESVPPSKYQEWAPAQTPAQTRQPSRQERRRCLIKCPRILLPVCARNSSRQRMTFTNTCLMKYYNCKYKEDYVVIRNRRCYWPDNEIKVYE